MVDLPVDLLVDLVVDLPVDLLVDFVPVKQEYWLQLGLEPD